MIQCRPVYPNATITPRQPSQTAAPARSRRSSRSRRSRPIPVSKEIAIPSSTSFVTNRTPMRATAGTRSRSVSGPTVPPAMRNATPPAAAERAKIAEFRTTAGLGPSRIPSTTITPTAATIAATNGPKRIAAATCAATENDALLFSRLTTNASAAIANPTRGATRMTECVDRPGPAPSTTATPPQKRALNKAIYRLTAGVTVRCGRGRSARASAGYRHRVPTLKRARTTRRLRRARVADTARARHSAGWRRALCPELVAGARGHYERGEERQQINRPVSTDASSKSP